MSSKDKLHSNSPSLRGGVGSGAKYSQLTAMLSITKASLRSILRNPSSVVFSLLFPLIFIVVFGFISGSFNVELGVMNGCDTNNAVFLNLKNVPHFKYITNLPDSVLLRQLGLGKLDAILNITKSQSDKPPFLSVELKTNKASPLKSRFTAVIISSIIDKVNVESSGAVQHSVEFKQEIVEGRLYKTIDFILPGQLGFSILSSGIFATAFIFLVLRETLVIKRFFATPIKKKYIILGEALSRLIFSMSGAVVIILIGYLFFGFTLVNGILTFFNMLLVCAIGLIVFLGFGFMVSGIAKNINTVAPIANLITLPQFLLAGTFFSIDLFPKWLQPISNVLPLTYLNQALRKISFEGAGIFDVGNEILILILWGAAAYALTIKFFRWE